MKVKLMTGLFVWLLVGCSSSVYLQISLLRPYADKTIANKMVHDFPDSIPGARSISKVEIPGATHCLVYIRNLHASLKTSAEQWKEVKAVQEDVYRILLFLLDTYPVDGKSVFIEAAQDTLAEFSVLYEGESGIFLYAEKIYSVLYDQASPTDYTSPDFEMCLRYSAAIAQFLFKRDATYATTRLRTQGLLETIPCEDEEALDAAYELIYYNPDEQIDKKDFRHTVFTNRENAVVRNIANLATTPLSILVFGGGHWFYDNIRSWNKINAENKFSLIVIEPEHFP